MCKGTLEAIQQIIYNWHLYQLFRYPYTSTTRVKVCVNSCLGSQRIYVISNQATRLKVFIRTYVIGKIFPAFDIPPLTVLVASYIQDMLYAHT